MSQKKFELINSDCVNWMYANKEKVDCIVTSPPYNINVKYGYILGFLDRIGIGLGSLKS